MKQLINNTGKMTSLEIAELTGKRHSDVLPKIEKILSELKDEEYIERNFSLNWYIAKNGKRNKMIEMSKSGSLFIASRYDVNLHLTVQKRWEALELEKQKPMSSLDMIQLSINAIRENQAEIQEVKQDILELKAQSKTRSDYFTIVGYATLNGISCGIKLASSLGRKASALCKSRNIATEELPDPRFGRVKTYPVPILQEVFSASF